MEHTVKTRTIDIPNNGKYLYWGTWNPSSIANPLPCNIPGCSRKELKKIYGVPEAEKYAPEAFYILKDNVMWKVVYIDWKNKKMTITLELDEEKIKKKVSDSDIREFKLAIAQYNKRILDGDKSIKWT
jgi:hypothetical protein